MNDQQRIEMAADNCEVLRARLARYEDAQGVPVATIAEQAREISSLRNIISECATACGAAVSVECSLAFMALLPKEIALKAQPSVVVLPPMVEFDGMVNRLFELDDDARKYCCRHWLLTLWKATLDRVCQLNSSPVSAGEPVTFKREERYIVLKLSDLSALPEAVGRPFAENLTAIQRRLPKRECLVIESDWPEYPIAWQMIESRVSGNRPIAGEQADNFTDRQLYDLIQQTHDNCMYGRNHNGWELSLVRAGIKLQARAALSAPSHGEQVREVTNQCAETCERAKLCATCAGELEFPGLPDPGSIAEARIPHHTSDGRQMLWAEVEVIAHKIIQGAIYSWVKEPGNDGGFYAPMMLSFRAAPSAGSGD